MIALSQNENGIKEVNDDGLAKNVKPTSGIQRKQLRLQHPS